MRLDADLGIDSIKRVEILSALQEQLPHAPVIRPEHLGTLQTLGQIVEFLVTATPGAPDPQANETETSVPTRAHAMESESTPGVQRWIPSSVALDERRSSEPARLRAGGSVWIGDDGDGLARALADHLRARGFQARLIRRDEVGVLPSPERLDGLLLLAPAS